MSDIDYLMEAVAHRTARHVSGSPLSEDNRMAIAEVMQKGSVIGLHADPDGRMVILAAERRRDGSRAYAVRWFDGDLAKGGLVGAKATMIREFEVRTGVAFGGAATPDAKPQKVSKMLNHLMKAVSNRRKLTVDRRPARKGLM